MNRLRNNAALLLLTAGLLVFGALLLVISNGDNVKSPDRPVGELGGTVVKDIYTGLSKGRYFGATIVFRVPKQVRDLEAQTDAASSDELIFTFPDGEGVLSSRPADATANLEDQSYQGTRHQLEIANKPGFYIAKREGRASTLLAAANVGPQLVTIQLSSTRGRDALISLAQQLAGSLRLRHVER